MNGRGTHRTPPVVGDSAAVSMIGMVWFSSTSFVVGDCHAWCGHFTVSAHARNRATNFVLSTTVVRRHIRLACCMTKIQRCHCSSAQLIDFRVAAWHQITAWIQPLKSTLKSTTIDMLQDIRSIPGEVWWCMRNTLARHDGT